MTTKTLLTALAGLALMSPAQAQEVNFKPYIGFDLERSSYDYNKSYSLGGGDFLDFDAIAEDSLNSFNIHIGNRFHKYFGAEFGYFRTLSADKNVGAADIVGTSGGTPVAAGAPFKTSVRIQGLTLDGLGYLPVDEQKRFELIGTAGVTWSKAKLKLTVPGFGSASDNANEFGVRAGGGAQFSFTDKLNIRGLVRYQTADFDDFANNGWTASIGLNYSF